MPLLLPTVPGKVHGIVSVYLEYLFVRLDTEKERITVAWLDRYLEREGVAG